jgi:hypothetical protein
MIKQVIKVISLIITIIQDVLLPVNLDIFLTRYPLVFNMNII